MVAMRLTFLVLALSSGTWFVSADRDGSTGYSLSSPYRQEEMSDALDVSHWPWKRWNGSYLVAHNLKATSDSPVVALFDAHGVRVRTGTVWFPSATSVSVRGAAADSVGTIFVSGGSRSVDGSLAFFIAQLDNNGRVSGVVRTTPFIALHLCTTGDGTIWALGSDRQAQRDRSANLILRQFSFARGQLRAVLDMASVESGMPMDTEAMSLFCNSNTVGMLLDSARASIHKWIELDVNTAKISTWQLPALREKRKINGLAFTAGGRLFATVHDYSSQEAVSALFTVEKQKDGLAAWVPVKGTFGSLAAQDVPIWELLGSEDNDLVYTAERNNKTVVLWSHVHLGRNGSGN
ncbi:MAG: hypothetical protein WB729_09010 [Candidatus Sulfotelmatobacter sp.]